jgi:acetylornithine deacetylase
LADPHPQKLLSELVSVQGVTGQEENILSAAARICDSLGLTPQVTPDGIILHVKGQKPGATLLFCSHLDTVPAGEGWTVAPYEATIRDDMLFGRGAVDAKASCAAIILTAYRLKKEGLLQGQWVGALSIGEEGNAPSLPRLLDKIGPVDAAVVGEPTQMDIATAQRGLMVLELETRGKQEHAARSKGVGAPLLLAQDISHLSQIPFPRYHNLLGRIRLTPTRINSGIADNLVPPTATAMVDVRTTPVYTNDEILSTVRAAVTAKVSVIADAWVPCEVSHEHPLVKTALTALTDAKLFASDAASDWTFLQKQNIPAIKLGPGNCLFSHTADERISISELTDGLDGYTQISRQYLRYANSRSLE